MIYMTENKKPHNRIAELRKEKGLTLQQVADAIGVGNNTISRYENGKREPKLETWIKLSNFFNVSISYLQGISNIPGKLASDDYVNATSHLKQKEYDKEVLVKVRDDHLARIIQIINACDGLVNKNELLKILNSESVNYISTYHILSQCLNIVIKGQTNDKVASVSLKSLLEIIENYNASVNDQFNNRYHLTGSKVTKRNRH